MKVLPPALACIAMSVATAWGGDAPRGPAPGGLPSACPAMVGLPYDPGLWRGNIEYAPLPLEQVRWFSGVGESTGYVECVAAADSLGSARATLLGSFAVQRPRSPAWREDGTWLSCDPGSDPGSCEFSPLSAPLSTAPPGPVPRAPDAGGSKLPFGA